MDLWCLRKKSSFHYESSTYILAKDIITTKYTSKKYTSIFKREAKTWWKGKRKEKKIKFSAHHKLPLHHWPWSPWWMDAEQSVPIISGRENRFIVQKRERKKLWNKISRPFRPIMTPVSLISQPSLGHYLCLISILLNVSPFPSRAGFSVFFYAEILLSVCVFFLFFYLRIGLCFFKVL